MTFFATFATDPFLGQPVWMWLAFLAAVAALLAFDLGVLHRGNRAIGVRESLLLSAFYIVLGLGFGGFVGMRLGSEAGIEYLTGFVVEKSLAMENVFVIAMIFATLGISREHHHRVLFWGVLGVIGLRAVMIGVGATLVAEFAWVLYVFAVFLMATGIKMLAWKDKDSGPAGGPLLGWARRHLRVTGDPHGGRFLVRLPDAVSGRPAIHATPLLLALVLIEAADILFAVDSVPAIFAITTDPYVVYTSNIFAVLGLRALYFALAAMLGRFAYLKPALAVLLVFIGGKIFVADLMGWPKFPATASLAVTFAILGAGILYSLRRTRPMAAAQVSAGGED